MPFHEDAARMARAREAPFPALDLLRVPRAARRLPVGLQGAGVFRLRTSTMRASAASAPAF
eukprot:14221232-Alexandrium_andersonii.AAC.1